MRGRYPIRAERSKSHEKSPRRRTKPAGLPSRRRQSCRPDAIATGTPARAAPRTFVARRTSPCRGHPLDQGKSDPRRQVSWLTGHRHAARPSQGDHASVSGPVAAPVAQTRAMCSALAAYSCRDSLGFGVTPSPRSLLSPFRDTSAVTRRAILGTVRLDGGRIETTARGQARIVSARTADRRAARAPASRAVRARECLRGRAACRGTAGRRTTKSPARRAAL